MKTDKTVFIITPFENIMTKRGNRHPLFAAFLTGKGYDVTYLTTNFYHAEKSHFSEDEIKRAIRTAPYDLIIKRNMGYKKILSIKRILSHIQFSFDTAIFLIRRNPKVIVIPSRPMELIFIVSLISFLKGSKVVLDVSDTWPEGFPVGGLKFFIFKLYCYLFLYSSMWNIKHFLYTAPSFIDWIKKYSHPTEALFVPLGYDEDRWKSAKRPSVEKGNWKFIFIGNFSLNFNFEPLIEAIGEDPNNILTMVGGGDNIDQTEKFIEEHGFKNIILTGFIDKHEVVDRMNEHDITVIPMIGPAFPNKLFDSIGGKRPLLILGENDAADFVVENGIGWSLPFDKAAIKRFIRELTISDYNEKCHNINSIRDSYTKELLYTRLSDLIDRIVKEDE